MNPILVNLFLALMVALSVMAFSLMSSAPDVWSMAACFIVSGLCAALAISAVCLFSD